MLEFLFITFTVIFCIQCIYFLFIFGNFSFSKTTTKNTTFNKAVSVIICAKNEANNLKKNIPHFLEQTYSNFEIVLINDASRDNTLEIIEQFKDKYPSKIKIVNVSPNEQFWGSKKYALTLGIKAASNEYLLFTNADCKPVSKNWIQEMSSNFSKKKQLILGYGSYTKIKKSFLNKLIRFETLLTAIHYFSFSKIGMPFAGVNRNLAYTKNTFFKANGFVNHMHRIKPGDGDLFVNQVATKNNTTFCISEDSFTEATPKTSFKNWILQKRRHITTLPYYKNSHKFIITLFLSSQVLFWLLSIVLLLFKFNLISVIIAIILRQLIIYLVFGYAAKKLNEKDLVLALPFYEIFLIFIQMFIFIKNCISKPTDW
ncbi:glycosyltransferase [Lutibacter sp. A64]|uniref:glycosyltransferase n=1 Tax=Lutibacter sp. A64 TaxID=2918526 RepID=UPI001F06E5B6|nr:glycosyltransferase [Lutibacter sp. A64]UMB55055.1 glycosyltransferase [Lutibacter sp. A64]